MFSPAALVLWLGLVLGIKHATEVDHLVAIANIVSESRSILRAAVVGVFWGVGHTISVFVVGVLVILLRVEIPPRLATSFEFVVALMIIFLGSRTLHSALRRRKDIHAHTHQHGRTVHTHLHFHDIGHAHKIGETRPHDHARQAKLRGWRAVVVGLVHGLAGSAALTLLVLTRVSSDSQLLGLTYLLVFGIGSIGGMLLMTTAMSLPLVLAPAHFGRLSVPVRLVAGIGSVAFGIYYAAHVLKG
jgi:ABC-type nickel/cobalt efflux system permease component RcnA